MGQLLVEGGVPNRNLNRAKELIERAAKQEADLILLPETIDFAWTHPLALERSLPIPGDYSDFFVQLAQKYSLYICVGLTEKTSSINYNTAILIDPEGNILTKYRKINLLNVEFPFYGVGKRLEVIELPWGNFGVNICSDNYFDSKEIGITLARMGAQVILSPCAWTVDHSIVEGVNPYGKKWKQSFDFFAETLGVATVSSTSVGYIVGGPYQGMKMMGGSLTRLPGGRYLECQFNEFTSDLLVFDLTLPFSSMKGIEMSRLLKQSSHRSVFFSHLPIINTGEV